MEEFSSSKLRKMMKHDERGKLTLDLSGRELSEVYNAVTGLHELEVLYLNNNNLTDLPVGFRHMGNLEELDLCNNDFAVVPTILQRMSQLKLLSLDDNLLIDLPAEISNMRSLDTLSLTGNKLTDIPNSIQTMTELRWLYLDNNQFTILPAWIDKMRWLTKLHVRNNLLTDDAMRILAELKKKNRNIDIDIHIPETPSTSEPEVFISYQWESQGAVLELKERLEKDGIHCWMDTSQMGGGDALYKKIDAGINASKVVICCVTQKYCQSENCQREATLADSRKKAIIPLLFEDIDWPPEGQLAMLFTKLLYIKMVPGLEAVRSNKFKEVLQKIRCHISK